MEIRADRFMSGHYAYFAELPKGETRKNEI